ncbi:MAG: hypothetical protein ACRD2X_06690, partial [Vicinamibacteraceae bacterium]
APELSYRATGAPAVLRAEVWLPRRRMAPAVPWIVSNPIFVRAATPPALTSARADHRASVRIGTRKRRWRVERDPASAARLIDGGAAQGLILEYTLRPGPRVSQFVAAVTDALRRVDTWRVLRFRARASRPMRLSVQLRQPAGEAGRRWAHSVYLDATTREVTLALSDFRPVADAPPRIATTELESLLLVVDTVNTRPGTRGAVWVDDIRVE